MQINSVTSGGIQSLPRHGQFEKVNQSFVKLGSALETGNLDDARTALAELQKNAPPKQSSRTDPISEKLEAVSQAVESGDLDAAKTAYADVKQALVQRPVSRGGRAGGGAPPGGGGKAAGASGSGNSTKTYDKRDANKDGTVSWKEKQDYEFSHPDFTQATTPETSGLDALA
jgi:hypothetical protein